MAFTKEYEQLKIRIEDFLTKHIDSLKNIPEPLFSSMKYSIKSGGKRIRPILFLVIYEMFGGVVNDSIEKIACALECIHTYSLIHDDLPCMDNDDLRRGKPTNHKQFNEYTAILTGDALLNLSYEFMFQAAESTNYDNKILKACKIISEKVGSGGLIAGQILDMESNFDENLLPGKLNYIYQHKTSDLFSAASLAAGIIAGASEKDLNILDEYANNFGYAFQIYDDIMDYTESKDLNKNTFVKFYGIKCAQKTCNDGINKAVEMISFLEKDTKFLIKLAVKSINRKE